MNQAFIEFIKNPAIGFLSLGMTRSDVQTYLSEPDTTSSRVHSNGLHVIQDEYDRGILQLTFVDDSLDFIILNLLNLQSDIKPDTVLDILKLPWIIDARELSLDQFLNLCAQINDIKCLRVTHDKGWIGYENEFILVKPHDIFFSFYDDIGLKLGRIESAVPPLPNYQYEEVALNN